MRKGGGAFFLSPFWRASIYADHQKVSNIKTPNKDLSRLLLYYHLFFSKNCIGGFSFTVYLEQVKFAHKINPPGEIKRRWGYKKGMKITGKLFFWMGQFELFFKIFKSVDTHCFFFLMSNRQAIFGGSDARNKT